MFMGKNTNTTRYETVAHLLLLAAVILAPFLVSIFMDLELFSVSKTMFISLWSSINPWLYPPYVYLLINFIIFFIFASSYIRSNTILFNPAITNDHNQSLTDSFIESSLLDHSRNLSVGHDHKDLSFHTLENTWKDQNDDLKRRHGIGKNKSKDEDHEVGRGKEVIDKRELRKSKTFHEGGSRWIGRKERYVKIVSQQELDRRVEAFICRFKNEKNLENSKKVEKGLEFGGVY